MGLQLDKLHSPRALRVVVSHSIDPRAHRIASHHLGIAGSQQFGRRTHIPHSRIEPKFVTVGIKDYWHSVVDWCGHSIRSRGQNGAGLDCVATGVFPTIPDSRECEKLAFTDHETVRLFCFTGAHPLRSEEHTSEL